jgi:hypothetical protein
MGSSLRKQHFFSDDCDDGPSQSSLKNFSLVASSDESQVLAARCREKHPQPIMQQHRSNKFQVSVLRYAHPAASIPVLEKTFRLQHNKSDEGKFLR